MEMIHSNGSVVLQLKDIKTGAVLYGPIYASGAQIDVEEKKLIDMKDAYIKQGKDAQVFKLSRVG